MAFVPFGQSVPLRLAAGGRIGFQFRLDFDPREADGRIDLILVSYAARILESGGREILVFHWHPESVSPVKHPHIHLSSRIRPIPLEPVGLTLSLAAHHIPTGPVALADVVRYLIADAGVEPRRPDWPDILGVSAT